MNIDTRAMILHDIIQERNRQDKLKAEGRFEHTPADIECADVTRITMLMEEVGEVARAMQNKDAENLREELIQVAAVALAWVEHWEKVN